MAVIEESRSVLNGKKGTTMVEAAIVMPLVILSIIAMIYLLINIYGTVALQSHMHLLIREECGVRTKMVANQIEDEYERDRIRRRAELSNINIIDGGGIISPWLEAETDTVYKTNMMTKNKITKKSFGRNYLCKESDIVRYRKIVSID